MLENHASLEEEALIGNAEVEAWLIVVGRLEHTHAVVGLDNDLWQRIVVKTKGQLDDGRGCRDYSSRNDRRHTISFR